MNILMKNLHEKRDEDDSWKSYGNITGYNAIDIYASTIERSNFGYDEINGGIYPRIVQIFGPSATGKTTLAIKVIGAIVARWRAWLKAYYGEDLAESLDFDIEENTPPERICSLLGWSEPQLLERMEYIPGAQTTALEIYNKIRYISGLKEKNREALMIDTGLIDVNGKPVRAFPPTPVLIDSLAVLNPEGIEDLEYDREGNVKDLKAMTNNMEGARDSKSNTSFFKKAKPFLDKYNIILVIINHLTQEINTNLYEAPKKHLPFLKPGEKLKGGNEAIYQSYTIAGLSPGEKITEKDPFYGDDIYGSKVYFSYVKNKNGAEGLRFPMIFDSRKGFLPELSDWEYLYEKSYGFAGSPARYYLEILPEITFTKKTLFEMCQDKPLLARAMSWTARVHMMSNHFKTPLPDIRGIGSMWSTDTRVAMILTATEPYPGYMDKEIDLSCVGLECIYPQFGLGIEYDMPRQFHINGLYNFDNGKPVAEGETEYVPWVTPWFDPATMDMSEEADNWQTASYLPTS